MRVGALVEAWSDNSNGPGHAASLCHSPAKLVPYQQWETALLLCTLRQEANILPSSKPLLRSLPLPPHMVRLVAPGWSEGHVDDGSKCGGVGRGIDDHHSVAAARPWPASSTLGQPQHSFRVLKGSMAILIR